MRISEINWGDDSAERDPHLLEYFFTSDAFRRIKERQKNIVIGRKGSGKSALRKKLESEFSAEEDMHVINLSPRYNTIRSILNDKELTSSFGQEIFFQHTWLRQILLDCLCEAGHAAKGKYASGSLDFARNISTELQRTSKDMFENISEIIGKVKVKAGNLGELGLHIERELRNIADLDALEFHISELAKSGAKFVILIDDLDLGWDNSNVANNLLLGLLAACNYLTSISQNIFCCIFMREDVYSLLITKTQHSDKYRNIERLRWSKQDLIQILRNRIEFNLKEKGILRNGDAFYWAFPETLGTSNTDNWLIERTLERPRELIQLARYYTESVSGEEPNDATLKEAEPTYSSWKLDDLCTEYSNQYPNMINIFSYWKTKFFRNKYHLNKAEITDMLLQVLADVAINEIWFNKISEATDIDAMLKILYEIGFIGDFVLGGEGGSKTFYSYIERHEPRFDDIQVHPCFRKAVNTVDRIRTKAADPE